MKIGYKKPTIEFEDFELNAAIAAGCDRVVNLGPGDAEHETCSDYGDYEELRVEPGYGLMSDPSDVTFYEGNCRCYLSSVGSTLLNS